MARLEIPQPVTEMKTVQRLRRELWLLAKTTYWIRIRLGATREQALRYASRCWLPEYNQLKLLGVKLGGETYVEPKWEHVQEGLVRELDLDDWALPEMPELPSLGAPRKARNGFKIFRQKGLQIVREGLPVVIKSQNLEDWYRIVAQRLRVGKSTVGNTLFSFMTPEERSYVLARLSSREAINQWSCVIWPEIQELLVSGQFEIFYQIAKRVEVLLGIEAPAVISGIHLYAPVRHIEAIRKVYPTVFSGALERAREMESETASA